MLDCSNSFSTSWGSHPASGFSVRGMPAVLHILPTEPSKYNKVLPCSSLKCWPVAFPVAHFELLNICLWLSSEDHIFPPISQSACAEATREGKTFFFNSPMKNKIFRVFSYMQNVLDILNLFVHVYAAGM